MDINVFQAYLIKAKSQGLNSEERRKFRIYVLLHIVKGYRIKSKSQGLNPYEREKLSSCLKELDELSKEDEDIEKQKEKSYRYTFGLTS